MNANHAEIDFEFNRLRDLCAEYSGVIAALNLELGKVKAERDKIQRDYDNAFMHLKTAPGKCFCPFCERLREIQAQATERITALEGLLRWPYIVHIDQGQLNKIEAILATTVPAEKETKT